MGGTTPTCIGGGTFKIGGTTPKFVPPILNVPSIHGYFFTGEETW
jgi:hypothetical protein